jgi:hypothetical protein
MRGSIKALLVCGALITAGLSTAMPAAAASAPTLDTSGFVCSNGVCQLGPGNVGVGFSVLLFVHGQQCGTAGGTSAEVTKVASGRLPPGLHFSRALSAITGTPTRTGTYPFAVQLANVNYASGQICGPTRTRPLTITIGTGDSDRLVVHSARLNIVCGYPPLMTFFASDANYGATYTVTETSTGKQINTFTRTSESPTPGGTVRFGVSASTAQSFPKPPKKGLITITDTVGGSATVQVKKVEGC